MNKQKRISEQTSMENINVSFDFTIDTPYFWNNFWLNKGGLGAGSSDPDSKSKRLQEYHRILWSKKLPSGETMELKAGSGNNYLTWNGFRFGSDSMVASFRYHRYQGMLKEIEKSIDDYHAFVEDYLHRSYTIGGMIIFPKRKGSINQMRGCYRTICDRMDLTLECIRRFYHGDESPLSRVFEIDRSFFKLFKSFEGYIDFFFLNDWVDSNYAPIIFGEWNGEFIANPLPNTVKEYKDWITWELDMVEKRNNRINDWQNKASNTTLSYYDQNAVAFVESTANVGFTAVQDRFVYWLPSGSFVLDFGCGSGRDTKYFLSKGFAVDATDGSAELCRMASEIAGVPVRQMLFSELDEVDKYDGIWACSSILHCPKSELSEVFCKMIRAVKDGGIIYTSFKYGEFEGERKGRHFTDFTEESFHEFIKAYPELSIVEEWVAADVRPGRGDEKWLNLILQKN